MAKQIEQTILDRACSRRFHIRLRGSAVVAVYVGAHRKDLAAPAHSVGGPSRLEKGLSFREC
jgi:hypothetical protein